jgi:hypothetical protein
MIIKQCNLLLPNVGIGLSSMDHSLVNGPELLAAARGQFKVELVVWLVTEKGYYQHTTLSHDKVKLQGELCGTRRHYSYKKAVRERECCQWTASSSMEATGHMVKKIQHFDFTRDTSVHSKAICDWMSPIWDWGNYMHDRQWVSNTGFREVMSMTTKIYIIPCRMKEVNPEMCRANQETLIDHGTKARGWSRCFSRGTKCTMVKAENSNKVLKH